MVDYEHNPFDVVGLRAFMQGLVDGGPTNSGHRTPTVFATLPSNCRTVHEVRANAWQVRHVLSSGVSRHFAYACAAGRCGEGVCRGVQVSLPDGRVGSRIGAGSARGGGTGICRGYLGAYGT